MSRIYVLGDRKISYEDGAFLTAPENRSGIPQLYECTYCTFPMQEFACDGDPNPLCHDCYLLLKFFPEPKPTRLLRASKGYPTLIAIEEHDPSFAGKWLLAHGNLMNPPDVSEAKALKGTMRTEQL